MSKLSKRIQRFLYGLLAASVFIVPFALAGLWQWFWLTVSILVLVLGWEIWSVIKHGYTISKAFWIWRDEHPVAAWFVLGSVSIGWIFLMLHLGIG